MRPDIHKDNLIVKLTFEFGVDILNFCDELSAMRKYVVADQLLRAGLSVGNNSVEAQNAESKADFIHKMKIAAKEGDEVERLLLLCQAAKNYPDTTPLIKKIESINKVLNKIIATTKNNQLISKSPNQLITKKNNA